MYISGRVLRVDKKRAFREFPRESELDIPARVRDIYYFSSFQRIKVAVKVVPLWTVQTDAGNIIWKLRELGTPST